MVAEGHCLPHEVSSEHQLHLDGARRRSRLAQGVLVAPIWTQKRERCQVLGGGGRSCWNGTDLYPGVLQKDSGGRNQEAH